MFLDPTIEQREAKAEVIKNFAEHLAIDLNAVFKGKNYNDRFFHWNVVAHDLIKELQNLGIEFNKALFKDTPLIHILIASPYITIEDKRRVIRDLRSFIPGTDIDILDHRGNTTLHYFLKTLIDNPSILLLECLVDRSFLHSMYSSSKEINSLNSEENTVLDLLNNIIENVDTQINEEVRAKFQEVLPELHAIRNLLIEFGARTAV